MDSTLVNIRRKMGLTQDKMASLLGISRNYLAQLESGRKPPSPRVTAMAEALVNRESTPKTPDVDLAARLASIESRLDRLERILLDVLARLSGGGTTGRQGTHTR